MANLNAADVVAKWQRNLSASGDSYKAGVNAVQTAPGELAARAADRMAQKVLDSVQSGRYQAAARKVTLDQWKQAATANGPARLASGAAKGKQKMTDFMGAWLPVMANVSQQVQSMPKGTIEDSLARVRKVMEAGKQFAGKSS